MARKVLQSTLQRSEGYAQPCQTFVVEYHQLHLLQGKPWPGSSLSKLHQGFSTGWLQPIWCTSTSAGKSPTFGQGPVCVLSLGPLSLSLTWLTTGALTASTISPTLSGGHLVQPRGARGCGPLWWWCPCTNRGATSPIPAPLLWTITPGLRFISRLLACPWSELPACRETQRAARSPVVSRAPLSSTRTINVLLVAVASRRRYPDRVSRQRLHLVLPPLSPNLYYPPASRTLFRASL
ncbi:hypothetical protein LZ30DRAFT_58574 [Colletotrichum cereale]|nr:hypothetical protein LZ30DRAFT_58574 [Colletotrichum cereale]